MGLVIRSSLERALWPQDRRVRFKTTWHRLAWPSVVEQIRRGYELARNDRAGYGTLAGKARARMTHWVDAEAVWPRLRDALDQLESRRSKPFAA
jgi:hypothetical protein